AALSRRLQGALRSPTFIVTNRYIHILAAGRESRIRVPVDNFTMIREPIYGGLMKRVDNDQPGWLTFDLQMWKGHRAFVELVDTTVADPADDSKKDGYKPDGYVSISRVIFSDESKPPPARESPAWLLLLGS